MTIDLKDLEDTIDKALAKETKDSINKFVKNQRLNEMLPIPTELLGQKAIPFMEWCNNAIILYRETYGNDNEIDIFKIKRILDFYNQPFTPEMLKYFDGKTHIYSDFPFKYLDDFVLYENRHNVELTWKGEKLCQTPE